VGTSSRPGRLLQGAGRLLTEHGRGEDVVIVRASQADLFERLGESERAAEALEKTNLRVDD
jgi:hypothetical protein